jgi:antitoxin component YwqK of YwqJK toxin-antitoxin module
MKSIKENDEEFMYKNIIQMYDLEFEEMTVGLHKGIPFEGFTFSMYPINGELKLLVPFKEGFEDGIYREWYENGQLKEVREITHGHSDGYKICWYSNGLLKSEVHYMEGFVICEKNWDEEENMIENKVFINNIDIYRTWYKKGMTRYQDKFENDLFTDGLCKLLIGSEWDEEKKFYSQGQEVLKYIEENIKEIYERECVYKHAVKKEMIQFNMNQAIYNDEKFTGLVYDMPFVEEVGAYILFSIYTYKNGDMHGNCLEWYSDGLVNPKKIIQEGCSDEGEYWYSKGFLKKYAHYELGNEIDYKEWDKNGNLIRERINN